MKRTKSVRKRLVAELDKVFSVWIRARDYEEFGSSCSLCGKVADIMQCAHLISRAKFSTRWDPSQCNAMCRGCNMRHEYYPQYHTRWWISRNGLKAYNELVEMSNKIARHDNSDLKAMIERFKHYP